ncbi:hypothetical protein CASFOL_029316 [Castilleja foliolosa]|uniref:Uncharacterized protein n=1 Tax=Castilleja foliolosa TaxID=1961234 RepID=A0ABD3CDQ1_9LAMI
MITKRRLGHCGGRGGGQIEDPLDDENRYQQVLQDVKNNELRREVRALRRCVARLETLKNGDSHFVDHDDDEIDNPFARAGGERHFRHRVADPGRDFGVRLEIPEFTGKVLPVVEIEGPPVYDEYPDEDVESEFEVVLETVDDNNFTTEVKYASLKSLNICRLGNEIEDNLNFAVEAVRATSENSDGFSANLLDVDKLKVCSYACANAKCPASLHSCLHRVQVANTLPMVKKESTIDNGGFNMRTDHLDVCGPFFFKQCVNANFVSHDINWRSFKHCKQQMFMVGFWYVSNDAKIKTRGRVFSNKGRMMQTRQAFDSVQMLFYFLCFFSYFKKL